MEYTKRLTLESERPLNRSECEVNAMADFKFCPINGNPNAYYKCSQNNCLWWLEKRNQCAVTVIANELTERPKKTNCMMCENYRYGGTCTRGAAVCSSNDMKRLCKYYHEKEVLDDE